MEIHLYNSKSKKKELFKPIDKDRVSMYVCGPTVYSAHHIGNARPAVIFDILAKLLRLNYKQVVYARNITDIDDKIINAANEQNLEISEIAKRSTDQYHLDMATLNVSEPDKEPFATKHIPEMLDFIQDLLDKENAYLSEDHVLFDITSYDNYGELSGRDPNDMIAGSRVKVQSYKKNPLDFVLWKPSKDGEIGWKSPWGRGRPGWHLECSTMILKIFGETIDIHGGGEDLRFPHHENESAQSYCKNDGKTLANFWLHNGMVQMENSKMSKSLDNILLIKDLIKENPGEAIRFSLISAHYRQPLKWSDKLVKQSKKTLENMYSFLEDFEENNLLDCDPDEDFIKALSDDLNTPKAISILHALFKKLRKEPKNIELRSKFIKSANILGLLQSNAKEWDCNKANDFDEQIVIELIEKRNVARENKNFEASDKIRKELLDMGIILEDNENETTWKKK